MVKLSTGAKAKIVPTSKQGGNYQRRCKTPIAHMYQVKDVSGHVINDNSVVTLTHDHSGLTHGQLY